MLAACWIVGSPQAKRHLRVSAATEVAMPGRTRRTEVADAELRLVSKIVGTGRYADGRDGKTSACGIADRVRACFGENIGPIQSGLPDCARDSYAEIIGVIAGSRRGA